LPNASVCLAISFLGLSSHYAYIISFPAIHSKPHFVSGFSFLSGSRQAERTSINLTSESTNAFYTQKQEAYLLNDNRYKEAHLK